MKVGSYEKLDDALYIWFRQQREKMSKLLVLYWWKRWKYCWRCYAYPESEKVFTGCTGFQWRFCKWHGIRNLSLQGEKASADADATGEFTGDFSSLTSSYSHDQIFVVMKQVYTTTSFPRTHLQVHMREEQMVEKNQRIVLQWMHVLILLDLLSFLFCLLAK